MSPQAQWPPNPRYLEGIYRPVIADEWTVDLRDHAVSEFGDTLTMHDPKEWRVHIFTQRELGSMAINDAATAKSIKQSMVANMPDSFFDEMSVFTNGIIIPGDSEPQISARLERNRQLASERSKALRLIGHYVDVQSEFVSEPAYFHIRMGRMVEASSRYKAMRVLSKNLPRFIRLGHGVIDVKD